MKELFQSGDWTKEKHIPMLEILRVDRETGIVVKATIGKEIPHPNTTAHHIEWIDIYFRPEDSKFPYHIGRYEFLSHGASVEGADTSTIYSVPEVVFSFKSEKNGMVYASSYCNIHGLWESVLLPVKI